MNSDWHSGWLQQETFFSGDSLYHPEVPAVSSGMAGDPVPYSVRGDNVITSLLLCTFILTIIAFSKVRNFVVRQTKSFFYLPHEGTTEVTATANEVRFQLFLVFMLGLLIALLYFFYTLQTYGDTFILDSQYLLIAIFLGIMIGYLLLKALLYLVVNNVFFDGKKNRQWMKSLLFIVTVEDILLFPIVLVQANLDLSIRNVETYFIVVLIFVKLLTIYKCYVIFFRQNVVRLQIILYFCALEMIPLLAVWGVLDITVNSLKINF